MDQIPFDLGSFENNTDVNWSEIKFCIPFEYLDNGKHTVLANCRGSLVAVKLFYITSKIKEEYGDGPKKLEDNNNNNDDDDDDEFKTLMDMVKKRFSNENTTFNRVNGPNILPLLGSCEVNSETEPFTIQTDEDITLSPEMSQIATFEDDTLIIQPCDCLLFRYMPHGSVADLILSTETSQYAKYQVDIEDDSDSDDSDLEDIEYENDSQELLEEKKKKIERMKRELCQKWRVSPSKRIEMAYQVAVAMRWLHEQSIPILHCQLRPSHILLDQHGDIYLCGFGQSKVVTDSYIKKTDLNRWKNIIRYYPPEIKACITDEADYNLTNFTTACDVYSFGVSLWEFLTGKKWYTDVNMGIKTRKIKDKEISFDMTCIPDVRKLPTELLSLKKLQSLIIECCAPKPEHRLKFSDIVERLQEALWNELIPDPFSNWWQESFDKKFSIPWEEFEEKIYEDLMGFEVPTMPKDQEIEDDDKIYNYCVKRCLQHFLSKEVQDPIYHKVINVVTPESYGNLISFLGPGSFEDISNRLYDLYNTGWFFGHITKSKAINYLSQTENRLLVRIGERRGHFYFCKLIKENNQFYEIEHPIIYNFRKKIIKVQLKKGDIIQFKESDVENGDVTLVSTLPLLSKYDPIFTLNKKYFPPSSPCLANCKRITVFGTEGYADAPGTT